MRLVLENDWCNYRIIKAIKKATWKNQAAFLLGKDSALKWRRDAIN